MVVTGGAGFVCSHLVELLVAGGARVTVIDDLRNGDEGNLATVRGDIELKVMSLDGSNWADAARGADLIFHGAANAYVPPSVEDPVGDFQQNLYLALSLLEWCRTTSPGTEVVLFSTAAVYGDIKQSPADESCPLEPISPYGVSKLAADRYAAVYAQLYGMRVASLRCFSVYGPRQHKQVVYDLIDRMNQGSGKLTVLGDGTQVRDLSYVEDVARGALRVALEAPLQGEPYNIGTGVATSISQLVASIGRALGVDPEASYTGSIRSGDPEVLLSDSGRLRSLGWSPEVNLDDGVRRTADWVRAQTGQPGR
ncbi:MAG: UDP-glucose 4-epimerase [Chloroflexota bacterium]|nr:UDP-glucose 4-epimerase [Chloroflexota bacterium]